MLATETTEQVAAFPTHDAGAIDGALAMGFRLLAAVEAFAAQFEDLGDIELPAVVGSETDQANLRTVAPLYLASELETARLLPAVEMLAGLFASGGLQADVGEASPLLATFWKNRNHRFTQRERQAFFARLFGATSGPALALEGGRNTEFESLMLDLTEALYNLDPEPRYGTLPASHVPVRTAANQLAANLIPRSGGIAAYAARDVLHTIQEALAILKLGPVQQAVGARSVWGAVQSIVRLYLREEADISSHVTRGKAGMLVLAWLAEILPLLDASGGRLVRSGDPVIEAAQAWLQSSLSLSENESIHARRLR